MSDHAQRLESMATMDGMIKVKVQDRDEPYLVPAVVLALSSDVWKASLTGEFKESLTKELHLRDVSDATFRMLLEFLLPSAAAEAAITEENVYVLTEVSVKYALAGLKCKCVRHLKSSTISEKNVEKRLYQAIKFQEDTETPFFREDVESCKQFLIDKYLHLDACGILQRIQGLIQEDAAEMSMKSTALTDQFMKLIWEVVGSTASRAKRARTQYWDGYIELPFYADPSSKSRVRGDVSVKFPELHAYLK